MSSWWTGGVGWVRGEGEADITREHLGDRRGRVGE